MPADNRSGCNQDEGLFPSGPQPWQRNPEHLVRHHESPSRTVGVESEQLLTQGEVFKDEVCAGPKNTDQPAEDVSKQRNHARNLTG